MIRHSVTNCNETNSIIVHEVQEGDTLYSIARTYNMPVTKIMELNQKTSHEIAIGEKLKVVKQNR